MSIKSIYSMPFFLNNKINIFNPLNRLLIYLFILKKDFIVY